MPCLKKAKLICEGEMSLAFAFGACLSRPNLTVTGPLDVWWLAIRLLLGEGRMIAVIILPQKEDSFRNCGSTSSDMAALGHVLLPLFVLQMSFRVRQATFCSLTYHPRAYIVFWQQIASFGNKLQLLFSLLFICTVLF